MATTNDLINEKLQETYPNLTYQGDLLAAFWTDQGFQPTGPGDGDFEFYHAQGATGTTVGDARHDFWTNVYAGSATFRLLLENGDVLATESSDRLRIE
jgi:hypothetical protein